MPLRCARCDSPSIVTDYDYNAHRAYNKCMMCGHEKFVDDEKATAVSMSSKPQLSIVLSSKPKEEEPVTEFKGNHKPCKNHPEKYAFKKGLCCACYTKENGVVAQKREKPVEEQPEEKKPVVEQAPVEKQEDFDALTRMLEKYKARVGELKTLIDDMEDELKVAERKWSALSQVITLLKEERVA